MFRARLAATLAAMFVACDGFFIVDSRIGCIDIVYLTFAAISYLLLFRFIQTPLLANKRRTVLAIGVALGLCLGSKLYVPAITMLLVSGFIFFTIWRSQTNVAHTIHSAPAPNPLRARWIFGTVLMIGSLSAIVYLASFMPHYILGWWGGVADLVHYYKDVVWYEKSVSTASHPYASPWWSWPLMLRPVAYWQNFPQKGDVAAIWGAGNPLTWWAVVPAMTITAVRAIERPSIVRTFLVLSFLAYYVIWIPIGRVLFLYHYMPSVYIGYLALGQILADLWNGDAELWESSAILSTTFIALLVGLGHIAEIYKPSVIPPKLQVLAGAPAMLILVLAFGLLYRRPRIANRFVCCVFLAVSSMLFIYYLPIWLGTPITRDGYYARMWLQGPGLRNWI
jgi:dolichyl-phosphate-mannose-protein mannosyltransferase